MSVKKIKPAYVRTTSLIQPHIFVAKGPHMVAASAVENSIRTPNKPEITTQIASSRLNV